MKLFLLLATVVTFTSGQITYDLTVKGGTGSGSYIPGTEIIITANTPLKDKVWTKWGSPIYGSNMFLTVKSQETKLTMPDHELTIEALYGNKCPVNAEERRVGIMAIINELYEGFFPEDVASAQHQAAEWLIDEDEFYVCPNNAPKVTQRYILGVFYFSTEGKDWNRCFAGDTECGESNGVFSGKTAYLSPIDECEWAGSICNRRNTLLGLKFEKDNNVIGTIPMEMASLDRLEELSMEEQMLMGTLPSTLRQIQRLRVLNLSSNLFSGTLPKSFYALKNLETLKLGGNSLSGTIHNRIGRLLALKHLELQDNKFHGSLPQTLTVLPLVEADFHYNYFSGEMPLCIGSLNHTIEAISADCGDYTDSSVTCGSGCGCKCTFDEDDDESGSDEGNGGVQSTTDTDSGVLGSMTDSTPYLIEVEGGNGDGYYPFNTQVEIIPEACPSGMSFKAWVVVSGKADIDNAESATAVLMIPSKGAGTQVRATCANIKYKLIVIEGTGSGFYEAGTEVQIRANKPSKDQLWIEWTPAVSDGDMIVDMEAQETLLIMPSLDLTIEASYGLKCPMNPEERSTGIMDVLNEIYSNGFPIDVTSFQHQAAEWLIEEDELYICPDDNKLMQRYVLTLFYFAMEGYDWNECYAGDDECGTLSDSLFYGKVAYLSPVDECGWAGSNCDTSGMITALQFEKQNYLYGTIPMEIGYLDRLEVLSMEDQMIMGALPSNLRRIQGLRVLNLAGNLISGTVPRGYYSLSNLEFLNLESNNLSGTISNRIGRLRSLLYLQLEDNDFSGSLPQSLTVIPLVEAGFHFNKFSGEMPLCVGSKKQTITVVSSDCGDYDDALVTCGSGCGCKCY